MVGNLVVNVTLSKWFVVNRGTAIAYAAMNVSFGGVVLTPLATYLIDTIGWRTAWLCLGGITALCMYPVAFFMRRAPEDFAMHPDGLSDAQMRDGGGAKAEAENRNAYTRHQALRTFSFYALVIAFGFFAINIVVMLLLFIYLEVGAMVGIYFKTNHMPVRFLIYVAITALTRHLVGFVNAT